MDMEALAGSVGSPAVFVGLGVTTLALVVATLFLSSRSSSDSSRGGEGVAAERAERVVEELDRSVSFSQGIVSAEREETGGPPQVAWGNEARECERFD